MLRKVQYGVHSIIGFQTTIRACCQKELPILTCLCQSLYNQKRWAGHSKWQNIKFKKMHKDNAKAKIFGQFSREIIQAVKENGADPNYNAKLEGLISKAKSSNMPKDKIENSIKSALRNADEKYVPLLLQARGPGKCGLMIDILTPNPLRTKPELKSILKKHEATFIEDGSVAFMFNHRGVVTVEESFSSSSQRFDEDAREQAEEVAIMIGAEDVLCVHDDDNDQTVLKFLCERLAVTKLQKQIKEDYPEMTILSADVQYLAKSLVSLNDSLLEKVHRLIEAITAHPDVIDVYENIEEYPSKTIKLKSDFET